ncbi:MAG: hypothetical protein ACK5L5_12000 [Bacteroidales bacterium]
MKNLLYTTMILLSLGLSSCNKDEGNSLGEYVISSATFHSLDAAYYLTNDNGETLWPAAGVLKPKDIADKDRVIVNYTKLGKDPDGQYDQEVKVNEIGKMLTKDMLIFDENTTEEVRDSIGNSPVRINGAWIVDDYLTVSFEMPIAYTTHLVNVVEDLTLEKTADGARILELKQNDNEQPLVGYWNWGIASFDISALQEQATDSMLIALQAINADGDMVSYKETLNYKFDGSSETPAPANFKKDSDLDIQ